MIDRVWIEGTALAGFDPTQDSATVTVKTEDGHLWAAEFVTLPYLAHQMKVSRDMAMSMSPVAAPTPFAAIESPHVIVENLNQDTIEDAIDNMMTLGSFESVFALQVEEAEIEPELHADSHEEHYG